MHNWIWWRVHSQKKPGLKKSPHSFLPLGTFVLMWKHATPKTCWKIESPSYIDRNESKTGGERESRLCALSNYYTNWIKIYQKIGLKLPKLKFLWNVDIYLWKLLIKAPPYNSLHIPAAWDTRYSLSKKILDILCERIIVPNASEQEESRIGAVAPKLKENGIFGSILG